MNCRSTSEPGASGLPYYCTSFCVRSCCIWCASCVDSKPKKQEKKCMVHCGSAFEPGASGLPWYCTSICVRSSLAVWIQTQKKIIGVRVDYTRTPRYIQTCDMNCGSAFFPGASELPYYSTQPVCVPAVLGALALWWQNT